MRQQMITSAHSAADYRRAQQAAPWAAIVVEVEGGYLAFENADEYDTWRRQR